MNATRTLVQHEPSTIFNFSLLRVCGSGNESDHVERERCSRVHLDAITSDNDGNMYAFRGATWLFHK